MNLDPEVIKELEHWAATSAEPDEPLLSSGRTMYSPNQIVEEVKEGTPLGER